MAIVTQKISLNLTQSKLPPLIMHTDEQGRRIHFELVDENGDVITLTDDYSARYSQKKPDGNFVSELLSISENGKLLILNQVTQMTAIPGISYYDIHVYNGADIIYSGQGRVVVDDHILDNDTIISVSEADGLVFPDDFYSKNDPVAEIDDNVTSLTKAWSSSKISDEIGDAISSAIGAIIDDNDQDTDSTWSSDKIASELSALSAITITPVYNASTLSNSDININYGDYDALIIYINDALTQSGTSNVFSKQYLDYCRNNSRTLTFYPFGTAYVSYNILTNKLEYAGDNNQGFYIIRIDGVNF